MAAPSVWRYGGAVAATTKPPDVNRRFRVGTGKLYADVTSFIGVLIPFQSGVVPMTETEKIKAVQIITFLSIIGGCLVILWARFPGLP